MMSQTCSWRRGNSSCTRRRKTSIANSSQCLELSTRMTGPMRCRNETHPLSLLLFGPLRSKHMSCLFLCTCLCRSVNHLSIHWLILTGVKGRGFGGCVLGVLVTDFLRCAHRHHLLVLSGFAVFFVTLVSIDHYLAHIHTSILMHINALYHSTSYYTPPPLICATMLIRYLRTSILTNC